MIAVVEGKVNYLNVAVLGHDMLMILYSAATPACAYQALLLMLSHLG